MYWPQGETMKTTLKRIVLHGQDIIPLLQRVITQDINQCTQPTLSAICNAKGKVDAIFWVQHTTDTVLWVDQSLVTSLLQKLRHFDPFCQLQFHIENQVVWSNEDFQFSEKAEPSKTPWDVFLIQQGILTLTTDLQGKYTPHMLNLDKLNAICLSKGCFVGYEFITKTQYKGRTKRRLCYINTPSKDDQALATVEYNQTYHQLVLISEST